MTWRRIEEWRHNPAHFCCAMSQEMSCRAVTVEARVLSTPLHVGFVLGKVALWHFSSSTSVCLCQCHSTNAAHSAIYYWCCITLAIGSFFTLDTESEQFQSAPYVQNSRKFHYPVVSSPWKINFRNRLGGKWTGLKAVVTIEFAALAGGQTSFFQA